MNNVIAPALILLGLALATSDTVASSSVARLGHSRHSATEVSTEVSPPTELNTPLRSLKKEANKKKRTKVSSPDRVGNVDSAAKDDNETEKPLPPAIPYSPRFVIPESMDSGDDWNHGSTGRLGMLRLARIPFVSTFLLARSCIGSEERHDRIQHTCSSASWRHRLSLPQSNGWVGRGVDLNRHLISNPSHDSVLPLRLDKWTRAAECFKSTNRQEKCLRAVHCIERNGPYCQSFKRDNIGGSGKDLGTVVFYRHLKAEDPGCWKIELPGRTTTWLTAISVSGVNKDKPIKRASGVSCDEEWEVS